MLEGKITRLQAAGIIHEALLNEKHEPDETNWEQALLLKDIYDCSKCVGHVAQVYVKGIILPEAPGVFGTQTVLTDREKEEILARYVDKSLRSKPTEPAPVSVRHISVSEASKLPDGTVYIDVRSAGEYCPDYMGRHFINIPLEKLNLNPYSAGSDLMMPVVLRCNKGYMSGAGAAVLTAHGYREVYVLDV